MEYATASPGAGAGTATGVRRRSRLDRFELAILAGFAAVSCWVLALDLYQVIVNGRIWTGTDGFFITDQMQYLAWIQAASHHLLVSNLFVLRPSPADYFQPAVAISGLLVSLGMVPWLALLLWKPVAVIVTFFGVRAYAHHSLTQRWQRRAALALALFYGSFTSVYGSFGVIGDMFPGFLSWGYPFGLIALGAMLYALVGYDRARQAGRVAYAPALLGALSSSLHPWQGEILIVLVIAAELASLRPRELSRRGLQRAALSLRTDALTRRRWQLTAVTVVGSALPLLYYLILGKADINWGMAREASKHSFAFWSILLVLAPILPFAALAYRGRSRSFWGTTTRLFPFAALAVYVFSASGASATPLHAFQGITVPLGVLAVDGVARTRWAAYRHRRLVGALVLALATIPATFWELKIANGYMGPQVGNANFIAGSERDALDYLDHDRDDGGVLTRTYLGVTVPARTGRHTFVGSCLWSTPHCSQRLTLTKQMFTGGLRPGAIRALVLGSGARFVLADCRTTTDLDPVLAPLGPRVRKFGCASVYEIDAPGPPTGPLAESPAHAAAVRTPRRQ
jgi:hypothetical protein